MDNRIVYQNANEPWIRYLTLVELLHQDPKSNEVVQAKKAMLAHPLIQAVLGELKDWPGVVLSSHKSANQLYHKLEFLAELGLTEEDATLSAVLNAIEAHVTCEGLFTLPTTIPIMYGGTGEKTEAWAACDAPVLLYCVAKMRKNGLEIARKGTEYLMSLHRENGWPCAVSPLLKDWHGPGKKSDPCPYVTLIMLKLLSLYPEYQNSLPVQEGIESLLHLWDNSWTLHPYIFYMGTDFRKLKLPFVWYDILHVADVLSRYESVFSDPRFTSLLQVIESKRTPEGTIIPEAIWKPWDQWDFGQKKQPSMSLRFFVDRILYRHKAH